MTQFPEPRQSVTQKEPPKPDETKPKAGNNPLVLHLLNLGSLPQIYPLESRHLSTKTKAYHKPASAGFLL